MFTKGRQLFALNFPPLNFFFLLLVLLSLVAFNTIVVGDFKFFQLRNLFLIEHRYGLGDVVEQAKHLAQVTAIDHRLEVVNLLIAAEKIEQIFYLLQRFG